jgi:hypothetical protein
LVFFPLSINNIKRTTFTNKLIINNAINTPTSPASSSSIAESLYPSSLSQKYHFPFIIHIKLNSLKETTSFTITIVAASPELASLVGCAQNCPLTATIEKQERVDYVC